MQPVLLFCGFFFLAIAYNLLGPLATNIMASTGMDIAQSGTLLSLQQVGGIASMACFIVLMKRVRQSTLTKIGYLFLAIAMLGITGSSKVGSLMLMYGVLGIGSFLIDSGSNAVISSNFREKRTRYVPLLHFSYSAGAIATGYLVLPFKEAHWRWAYGVTGISVAIILLLSLLNPRGRDKRAQGISKPEIRTESIKPLLTDKPFLLYTLVVLLNMGSQVVCSTWIPVYVETELMQPAALTAASLSAFWTGTAISRLVIGPLIQRFGRALSLSIAGMVLAGCSLAGVALAGNTVLVFILIASCGFFAGYTIPVYIIVTTAWFPQHTAFISFSYILSGTVGMMIFPWAVAVIAANTSLGTALLASSLILFTSSLLLVAIRSTTRERPSR